MLSVVRHRAARSTARVGRCNNLMSCHIQRGSLIAVGYSTLAPWERVVGGNKVAQGPEINIDSTRRTRRLSIAVPQPDLPSPEGLAAVVQWPSDSPPEDRLQPGTFAGQDTPVVPKLSGGKSPPRIAITKDVVQVALEGQWPSERIQQNFFAVLEGIQQDWHLSAKAAAHFVDKTLWIKTVEDLKMKCQHRTAPMFEGMAEAEVRRILKMLVEGGPQYLWGRAPARHGVIPTALPETSGLEAPQQQLGDELGVEDATGGHSASKELVLAEVDRSLGEERSSLIARKKQEALQKEHRSTLEGPLFTRLLLHAHQTFGKQIEANKTLQSTTDLSVPHQWFPITRLMKRKVIYHGGPTNSGKTYHALERLKDAQAGLFCGPLRLLALEVYEKLNRQGIYCSLMTGQEQRVVPFATHVSCTVEKCYTDRDYDVAVIDEIQMIGNPQRGAAWTKALMGVRAKELHVAGGIEAAPLVQALVEDAGDEFELHRYERIQPLQPAERHLGSYAKVQPGDCVVAFSKKNIFAIRDKIEATTPYKCCVVFGQLPPEVRSEQAKRFNEPGSDYDILVASDAIGMGLNLNIKRVIFHTLYKTSGPLTEMQLMEPTLLKQIAGRAGRHGGIWDNGEVTCLKEEHMDIMREVLATPLEPIRQAGVFPPFEHVQEFVKTMDPDGTCDIRLSEVFNQLISVAQLDGQYFIASDHQLKDVADALHPIKGLSLEDRYTLCQCPISGRSSDDLPLKLLVKMVTAMVEDRPVALDVQLPGAPPRHVDDLTNMCIKYSIMDMYLWLANRFKAQFVDLEFAYSLRQEAVRLIDEGVRKVSTDSEFPMSRRPTRDPSPRIRRPSRRPLTSPPPEEEPILPIPVPQAPTQSGPAPGSPTPTDADWSLLLAPGAHIPVDPPSEPAADTLTGPHAQPGGAGGKPRAPKRRLSGTAANGTAPEGPPELAAETLRQPRGAASKRQRLPEEAAASAAGGAAAPSGGGAEGVGRVEGSVEPAESKTAGAAMGAGSPAASTVGRKSASWTSRLDQTVPLEALPGPGPSKLPTGVVAELHQSAQEPSGTLSGKSGVPPSSGAATPAPNSSPWLPLGATSRPVASSAVGVRAERAQRRVTAKGAKFPTAEAIRAKWLAKKALSAGGKGEGSAAGSAWLQRHPPGGRVAWQAADGP